MPPPLPNKVVGGWFYTMAFLFISNTGATVNPVPIDSGKFFICCIWKYAKIIYLLLCFTCRKLCQSFYCHWCSVRSRAGGWWGWGSSAPSQKCVMVKYASAIPLFTGDTLFWIFCKIHQTFSIKFQTFQWKYLKLTLNVALNCTLGLRYSQFLS